MRERRVLVLSPKAAYPPHAGNSARIASLLHQLRTLGCDVWFGGMGLDEAQCAVMRRALGDRFLAAAPVRLRMRKRRFQAMMSYFHHRLAERGWLVPDLDLWYRDEWDASIRAWHAEFRFDVVIVEYVFYSKALLGFGTHTLKVIDTHDVFAGRYRTLKGAGGNLWFVTNERQERRGLNRADVVLAIQDHEAEYFRRQISDRARVVTVGHYVDIQPVPPMYGHKCVVGYLGSDTLQNWQTIAPFVERVWPRVLREVPGARLLIAGGIARRCEIADGIDLLQDVDDVRDVYARAMVMVNPIRLGTGLKIKSIEAMAAGRPLVSTSVGAHGLERGAGEALLIADSDDEFVRQILRLFRSPELHAQVSRAAAQFAHDYNAAQVQALIGVLELSPPYRESRASP